MAEPGKRKPDESDHSELETTTKKPRSFSGSQSSNSTSKPAGTDVGSSEADEIIKAAFARLPPIQQWSSATIGILRFAVNEKYPKAEWQEESELTRRLLDAILTSNEGWNWQRLKTCSNAEYFSLPTHIITLLNAVFYTNRLDPVRADCDAQGIREPSGFNGRSGRVGYPIFRVDYSSDENFELYKTCWSQYMETQFYIPGYVAREDVTWHWVEDKATLEGKGPREVRELFQSLCDAAAFPHGSGYQFLWVCLMVDRDAIESMLRVYGPPATEIFTLGSAIKSPGRRQNIPFLPYVTALSTSWTEENMDEESSGEESESDRSGSVELGSEDTLSETSGNEEVDDEVQEEPLIDDGEYHGHFKCAVKSLFQLWQDEQVLPSERHHQRGGRIWGDIGIAYEAPDSLH